MQTSYFANRAVASRPNSVAICLYPPKWYHGRRYSQLAPTQRILEAYKEGRISPSIYEESYRAEVLDRLDPAQVLQDLGGDAILLCWEKPGEFCHRRLVAKWFEEELGIMVPEYDVQQEKTVVKGTEPETLPLFP